MSTITLKNTNDFTKILESRISLALKMTQDEIYKVFQRHLADYYEEPVFNGSSIPAMYDRQYRFLNSLIKTNLTTSGNSISCTVEVDPNYLNYTYVAGRQGFTGKDAWLSANQGYHGWSIEGDMRVWDDALGEIGLEVGIKYIMKKNLQKCGISVQ